MNKNWVKVESGTPPAAGQWEIMRKKDTHLKTDAEGEGECDQNQNWKS